jgi:hypothetical protein
MIKQISLWLVLLVVMSGWWQYRASELTARAQDYQTQEVVKLERRGRMIAWGVEKGITESTIVLLLMLPLVATIVSVLHYVGGLSGYGIFMPTMLSVVLINTGIAGGLMLFGMILLVSLLTNLLMRRLKLHFWPSRSINLVLIGVGTFALMAISADMKLLDISKISIYPILFMILLAEEFVRTQLVKSKNEAVRLTMGTLVLSVMGAGLMSVEVVQRGVLNYPEAVIVGTLLVNLAVGNYAGMRLTELGRFKKAKRVKKIIKDKK